jgi:hypothetical protein
MARKKEADEDTVVLDPSWRQTRVDRLGISDADLFTLCLIGPMDAGELVAWFRREEQFLERLRGHLARFRCRLSNDQIHDFDALYDSHKKD